MSDDLILEEYAAYAADIAPMFEALATADVLAPVMQHVPPAPATIADIGAGTGRDADWFAKQGYRVVAVEPVAELADYGKSHHDSAIEWVSDTLPSLDLLSSSGRRFDLIFIGSVWHHLDPESSLTALGSMAALLTSSGRIILSLKEIEHDDQSEPTLTAQELRQHITQAGLKLSCETRSDAHPSHSRLSGNSWVWFVITQD